MVQSINLMIEARVQLISTKTLRVIRKLRLQQGGGSWNVNIAKWILQILLSKAVKQGEGGQKRSKFCKRSLWTTPYLVQKAFLMVWRLKWAKICFSFKDFIWKPSYLLRFPWWMMVRDIDFVILGRELHQGAITLKLWLIFNTFQFPPCPPEW